MSTVTKENVKARLRESRLPEAAGSPLLFPAYLYIYQKELSVSDWLRFANWLGTRDCTCLTVETRQKQFWSILRKEGPLLCNKEAGAGGPTPALNSVVFLRPFLVLQRFLTCLVELAQNFRNADL